MFIKQETPFKAWRFSSNFNFACKDGRVTAATCKQYCPLVVNPTLPIVAKSSILNVATFLDPSLKASPCTKFRVITSLFSYHFKMLPPLSEVIFTGLLDCCYQYLVFMDPVNGCSKSKLSLSSPADMRILASRPRIIPYRCPYYKLE